MTLQTTRTRRFRLVKSPWLLCLSLLLALGALSGRAEPPPAAEAMPGSFSPDAAIRWALQQTPEITALREQHGIAAAAIVIAETYPFNPLWEAKVRYATG